MQEELQGESFCQDLHTDPYFPADPYFPDPYFPGTRQREQPTPGDNTAKCSGGDGLHDVARNEPLRKATPTRNAPRTTSARATARCLRGRFC